MNRPYRRTPKRYDGIRPTSHHLHEILPSVLQGVQRSYADRPDLILSAWKQVVGPSLAGMTEAVSFHEGLLTVKVKNSSLYTLLKQYEKSRLLQKMRQRFPKTQIKTIIFRLG